MDARDCSWCGEIFDPNSWNQKYCEGCRDEARAAQNRKYLEELRREQGARIVGEEYPCSECGDPFVYRAGPQHRCKECQKRAEIDRIHEWLSQQSDEKMREYRRNADDNYRFGGNRQKALERDGHQCQRCEDEDDLHVHHIDGSDHRSEGDTNNDLDNLVTLCRGCHAKTHHEQGDIPDPPARQSA